MARLAGLSAGRSAAALVAWTSLCSLAPAASAQPPEPSEEPRYLAAVRQELERLEKEPECQPTGRARAVCTFRHEAGGWEVRVVVSDASNTVYLTVLELARIDPDSAVAGGALRRLAELNWDLLGTRLDWNPRDGSVRLSAVQHVDTNFDRRAFRILVRLLLTQAERLAPALR